MWRLTGSNSYLKNSICSRVCNAPILSGQSRRFRNAEHWMRALVAGDACFSFKALGGRALTVARSPSGGQKPLRATAHQPP
jgi:hypothetical protein